MTIRIGEKAGWVKPSRHPRAKYHVFIENPLRSDRYISLCTLWFLTDDWMRLNGLHFFPEPHPNPRRLCRNCTKALEKGKVIRFGTAIPMIEVINNQPIQVGVVTR